MRLSTSILALVVICAAGSTMVKAQVANPIVPLSAGNTWYYHATGHDWRNISNDVYKATKTVTGFAADGSAVITSLVYHYNSSKVDTSTEYWQTSRTVRRGFKRQ